MTVKCDKCIANRHYTCGPRANCDCLCRTTNGKSKKSLADFDRIPNYTAESDAHFESCQELIKAFHAAQKAKEQRVQDYRDDIEKKRQEAMRQ